MGASVIEIETTGWLSPANVSTAPMMTRDEAGVAPW